MNELKSQIIEKIEGVVSAPPVQKGIAAYSVTAGGSVSFELIQGWLGIVSVTIGIVAGLLVIRSNYRKGQVNELERERAEVELRIKQKELADLEGDQGE